MDSPRHRRQVRPASSPRARGFVRSRRRRRAWTTHSRANRPNSRPERFIKRATVRPSCAAPDSPARGRMSARTKSRGCGRRLRGERRGFADDVCPNGHEQRELLTQWSWWDDGLIARGSGILKPRFDVARPDRLCCQTSLGQSGLGPAHARPRPSRPVHRRREGARVLSLRSGPLILPQRFGPSRPGEAKLAISLTPCQSVAAGVETLRMLSFVSRCSTDAMRRSVLRPAILLRRDDALQRVAYGFALRCLEPNRQRRAHAGHS